MAKLPSPDEKTCTNCERTLPIDHFLIGAKKCRDCDGRIPKPRPDPATCTHHRLCGDAAIFQALPDFFRTHAPAEPGYEWQVCRLCNDAQLVQIHSYHDAPGAIEVITQARANSSEPAPTILRAPVAMLDQSAPNPPSPPLSPGAANQIAQLQQTVAQLQEQLRKANLRAEIAELDWRIYKLQAERDQLATKLS